jgi:hypothetical protein
VPLGGLQKLPGTLVVVRDQCGLLVEAIFVDALDRLGDRAVNPGATPSKLRLVRHGPRERMLERVLRLRVEDDLVEELGVLQCAERRGPFGIGKLHDTLQDRLRDPLADHCCALEHVLLPLRQPVDARGQDGVDRVGNRQVLDGPDEAVGAPGPLEVPRLGERPHRFLDEERVPPGPVPDQIDQACHARVAAQQVPEQLSDRLRPERDERKLLVERLPHPRSLILGTEVQDHERAAPCERLDEVREERVAPRVEPVEVLEDRDGRVALAPGLDDALHHADELTLPRLRIEHWRGPFGVRNPEEVVEDGERLAEPLVQEQKPPRDLLACRGVAVLIADSEERPEELEHREEREGLSVGHAVRLVGRDAPCATPLEELRTESTLPDAGLPDDPDDLALPVERPLQAGLEDGHLARSADELREAAGAGDVETGADLPESLELVDADRRREPLDPRRAEVPHLEVARDERGGVLGQVDAIGRRDLLHARRETHGVPLGGVIHAEVVPDLPDHHLAGVEPHPDREADPPLDPELVRVAAELVPHVKGRVAGALRVVLVGDRRPEERHDPVTCVLVHSPFESVHPLGQDLEEAIHDPVPLLGVELLLELHGALDVGEQDRDLLPLTLEGGLGLEDLVGEVLGGVGARFALGGDRGSTLVAEPDARGQLRLARGAPKRHPGPALEAEPRVRRVLVSTGRAVHRQ